MYFEFLSPVKVVAGFDAVFNLPNELERLGCSKPLIVTDKGIVSAGILRLLEQAFNEMELKFPEVFDDVPLETSKKSLGNAFDMYNKISADSVIAVGGGSVIDSAKALCAMISKNSKNLEDLSGANTLPKRITPFIAVPTTSGTGSEVTSVAVILDEDSDRKIALASEYLMPDVAILDPNTTISLPKRLTAASGIDALSHAIESCISIQSNPFSKAVALMAIKIIFDNLPAVLKEPNNKEKRLNMLIASTMAGMAFSNAMVGIVHSLAHAAGAVLHIPHGVAISLFLVDGIRENLGTSKKELSDIAEFLIREHLPVSDAAKAEVFIIYLEKFLREIRKLSDLPSSLKDFGYTNQHKDRIIELAMIDGSSIFNKVKLTKERLSRIIDMVSQ